MVDGKTRGRTLPFRGQLGNNEVIAPARSERCFYKQKKKILIIRRPCLGALVCVQMRMRGASTLPRNFGSSVSVGLVLAGSLNVRSISCLELKLDSRCHNHLFPMTAEGTYWNYKVNGHLAGQRLIGN